MMRRVLSLEGAIERPKVIYNAKTDKFVMYFHWSLKVEDMKQPMLLLR